MPHVYVCRAGLCPHKNAGTESEMVMNDRTPPPFEEQRLGILDDALMLAPFEGWTDRMIREAGASAGVSRETAAAAFPRGVVDILTFWSERLDAAMLETLEGSEEFGAMKIREKVAFAVRARLDAIEEHKEAARRAAATLALAHLAATGSRLVWRTADRIWRGLGDTSTDFNFYSKRAVLSGVWISTFARWLSDDSVDGSATEDFLKARIENVMQFEKAKARVRDLDIDRGALLERLARLRYPVRRG